MRRLALPFCLLMLTACQANLAQLKEQAPEADDFPNSLAAEYLAYAESESEQGHKSAANYFAGKGLDALANGDVEPEAVDVGSKLASARAMLMNVRNEDIKHVAAQKLARAQLLFDCWQQESAAADACAEEFQSVVAELQKVAESFVFKREHEQIISFAKKSTMLEGDSMQKIDEIANHVPGKGYYVIVLEAFPGKSSASRARADERLKAVKHALVEKGVNERRIKIEKHSDAKAVHLSDDESEQYRGDVKATIKTTGKPGGQ